MIDAKPPKFDPKLRQAMEEIKPILMKYDCVAAIALASPTHSEFLFEPTASWSLAFWENKDQGIVRIRSKREDFPSQEAQKKALEATLHAMESVRWLSARFFEDMSKMIGMVQQKMSVMTDIARFFNKPDSSPGGKS